MEDTAGLLKKTGENTRVGRQLQFTDAEQIRSNRAVIKAYIEQAIAIEQAGLKVEKAEHTSTVEMPIEFSRRLEENMALKEAFESLTPGRRKAYLYHFGGAKQAKTRESRIDKLIPRILAGKGLHD
ncbi:YdeI/OmpD-associated family protein [Listeria floridensis]|uniref:YdeI/OmpD-associated family protein n=1 Tax=Listeria floridensis TaxID=1494962 RepID=UPI0004B3A878